MNRDHFVNAQVVVLSDMLQIESELATVADRNLDDATFVRGDGFSVIYRRTKDKTKIAWEQIAGSYRMLLDDRPELDTIQSLYTRTEPGTRPLLIKWED